MNHLCEDGPRVGLPHVWLVEPAEPDLRSLTAICRHCRAVRTYPKNLYPVGVAASRQAQNRLCRTMEGPYD